MLLLRSVNFLEVLGPSVLRQSGSWGRLNQNSLLKEGAFCESFEKDPKKLVQLGFHFFTESSCDDSIPLLRWELFEFLGQ